MWGIKQLHVIDAVKVWGILFFFTCNRCSYKLITCNRCSLQCEVYNNYINRCSKKCEV